MIVMAATDRLNQMLAELSETFGQKLMRKTKKYNAVYRMNKKRGTETMQLIGLPYRIEYEFCPGHLLCIESYAEHTTNWGGDITYRLTDVLVWIGEWEQHDVASLDDLGKWCPNIETARHREITHWMPLPEPPK